jgi:hypothetical protein
MASPLIFPHLSFSQFRQCLLWAVKGGIIGGVYGIVHDAITYRLGPTYFEDFKFDQFKWADHGWPRHLFALEIGFLASWWVGFFAAYLLARYCQKRHGYAAARAMWKAIRLMLGCALCAATTVGIIGHFAFDEEFQRVAWIHNSSYAGGFVGLLLGFSYLKRTVP